MNSFLKATVLFFKIFVIHWALISSAYGVDALDRIHDEYVLNIYYDSETVAQDYSEHMTKLSKKIQKLITGNEITWPYDFYLNSQQVSYDDILNFLSKENIKFDRFELWNWKKVDNIYRNHERGHSSFATPLESPAIIVRGIKHKNLKTSTRLEISKKHLVIFLRLMPAVSDLQ